MKIALAILVATFVAVALFSRWITRNYNTWHRCGKCHRYWYLDITWKPVYGRRPPKFEEKTCPSCSNS